MANNWAFATLAELKLRLGITDTTDDALLTSLLDLTAGTIEAVAGRPLRRCHARTEHFTGGTSLIQLDAYPIAKIHSVRESLTRNFEAAGAYQELVEGTDFVADPGSGGRYGETGQLRRTGARWAGSLRNPGCIQVVYTGGYKTDDEAAKENSSLVIASATDIRDFSVQLVSGEYSFGAGVGEECGFKSGSLRAVIRFDTRDKILPTWGITTAVLDYSHRHQISAVSYNVTLIKDYDPEWADAALAYAAVESGAFVSMLSTFGTTFSAAMIGVSAAIRDALTLSLQNGYIAFGFMGLTSNYQGYVGAVENATPANRPKLTVYHRRAISDPYDTPDDLRNANLLQAVHEYQTRRTPGMISQATRGTILPSGSSYLKTAADLLPEVQRIAMGYRRLI